jgi:hypothetical protein
MLVALALFGITMLSCALYSTHRPSHPPTLACLERYKEVIVLLQAGNDLEARAHAVLIPCEHVRIQALRLVERSRPLTGVTRANA